jgi:arsenate reductase-like glutaredoxin family protein
MLKLYRTENCRECDRVQALLRNINYAHEIIFLSPAEVTEKQINQVPALNDDDRCYQGMNAVLGHIEELQNLKDQWDKFQGDSCYCGDDGEMEGFRIVMNYIGYY